MKRVEVRDGTHVVWLQPPGWQQSAVFISKPESRAFPLINLNGEAYIGVTEQARKMLSPKQAREVAKTLILAAGMTEKIQRSYNRRQHGKAKS